ncbi:hypothetical protein [Bradyrhizobium sp. CCBAU 51753]|uniref:hypothetical protein n=1 Tax=Bradyrhizobium sp. CCBAU 51753 TaxID=1325100 RepID=UPI00188DA2F8|nr:hypothetical protein [Bradyrhizobium sp. CCBAU 51753]QOZ24143.1 hypothetical protein XH93_11575 [Bradyrhizobium sp. CCBAU 51753]
MGRSTTKITKAKIDGDVVWKLVDARCKALSDVIAATRVPFLLALSWALLWFWALYATDKGYVQTYRARYAAISSLIDSQNDAQTLKKICNDYVLEQTSLPSLVQGERIKISDDFRLNYCKALIVSRRDLAEKTYFEQWLISFPGGFGKIHVTDLGIVGNLAFVLILSWTFYAIRRENLAVESFVKSDADRANGYRIPKKFNLIPQGDIFSGAHFAYAYQVVAQRFLFIIGTNSRPLLATTVVLCVFPSVVSLLDLLTDIRDLLTHTYETEVWIRVMIGMVLFGIVCLLTEKIAGYIVDTSVLLNGWNLAVRDVWMKDWNDPKDETAPMVIIDRVEQKAFKA